MDHRQLAQNASQLDVVSMPGALPALLQMFEATMSQDIDSFEPFAVRSLGRLVGFDGAVWGSGVVAVGRHAGLSITRASVVDRPDSLLSEYPEVAPHDPVTARFLACPDQPITVDVDAFYRPRSTTAIRDYLHRHHIGQLLLVGSDHSPAGLQTNARHWITAYRDSPRPFDGLAVARLHALLPLWNQARELCLARHMERLARAHALVGSAIAICDRAGLIHAAEPAFSELTTLRRGDSVPREALASPREASAKAGLPKGINLRVTDAHAWLLLQATRDGICAALSQREKQVARHYADGLSHKDIARALGSSPSTVRTQLQNIYRRLGVHSRTELQRSLAADAASDLD